MLLVYADFLGAGTDQALVAVLERLGRPASPWSRAVHTMFIEAEGRDDRVPVLLRQAETGDRALALAALQWASVLTENEGERSAAASYVDRALDQVDEATTPWQVATLHTQKAYLALQRGDHAVAAEHAELAVPVLYRLRAPDDAVQALVAVVLAAILDDDLVRAEDVLTEVEATPRSTVFGSAAMAFGARAELSLAKGDHDTALAAFDAAVAEMRQMRFPGAELTGSEPWVILAESTALTAFARFASGPEQCCRRDELGAELRESLARLLGVQDVIDYPVAGMALAATAAWFLVTDADPERGVRLLAQARGFGYNQMYPVMAWDSLVGLAETAAPGRLDVVLREYDGRRGRELRDEVLRTLALTSSA
jgi:tetratricopeptide (TPR) repeat protein